MKKVVAALIVAVIGSVGFWWWTRSSPEELASHTSANRSNVVPDPQWVVMFDGLSREWESVQVPKSEGGGR